MKHYFSLPLFFIAAIFPFLSFCTENLSPLFQEEHAVVNDPKNETLQLSLEEGWPNLFESKGGEDSFQGKFFNMLFILFLLIGFMVLASFALKRMMRAKVTELNRASSIKVLETRTLSPRATLYLIEVQGKSYLIAESPSHVTHLAVLESVQNLWSGCFAAHEPQNTPIIDFEQVLKLESEYSDV